MKPPIERFEPLPIDRVLSPVKRLMHMDAASGLLLVLCAGIAIVLANSPFAHAVHSFWELELGLTLASTRYTTTLHHFINDGLMAVFFFLVGLEIKREFLVGQLASRQRAALPIAAALGGMVVPAGLYLTLNASSAGAVGWGIPMATDIAFALGVIVLLGPAVPVGLKVFLTALAIVDDIGAVLVIAVFYTDAIGWTHLLGGFLVLAISAAANRAGLRSPIVYVVLGLILWVLFQAAGVHATVAGVLLALTIPARTRINATEFIARSDTAMDLFRAAGPGSSVLTNQAQQDALYRLEQNIEAAQAPLQRIEHSLQGIVAFGILPLFALANAGVTLSVPDLAGAMSNQVTLGIILGLVFGKPIGITLFAWLAVRLGLAQLPERTSWAGLHAVSWLGGIGFTMSLFIAGLAFTDASVIDQAKIGIFTASLAAAVVGWTLLRRLYSLPRTGSDS